MGNVKYNPMKIYDYLFTNKITRVNFAKECGISLKKLNNVLNNITPVDFQTLNKISTYINIKVSDLITYEL